MSWRSDWLLRLCETESTGTRLSYFDRPELFDLVKDTRSEFLVIFYFIVPNISKVIQSTSTFVKTGHIWPAWLPRTCRGGHHFPFQLERNLWSVCQEWFVDRVSDLVSVHGSLIMSTGLCEWLILLCWFSVNGSLIVWWFYSVNGSLIVLMIYCEWFIGCVDDLMWMVHWLCWFTVHG